MHISRFTFLISLLLLTLLLAACGGAKTATETPQAPAATASIAEQATHAPVPPAATSVPPTATSAPSTATPAPTQPPMSPDEKTAADLWRILQSKDYQNAWTLTPGKGKLYAGQGPHGMLLTTYLNEQAFNAYEAKPGAFSDGAIIVKENYMPDKTLAAITVMVKKAGFDANHNDWFWAKYAPDGSVQASGKPAGCISCHGSVRSNDYVFTFPVAPIPPEGPAPSISEAGGQTAAVSSGSSASTASTAPEAAPNKPDIGQVKALLQKGGCAGCHTIAGIDGALGDLGPNFCIPAKAFQAGEVTMAFLQESIVDPNAKVEKNYPANIMPQGFSNLFTPDEITILAAFIATLDCPQ